MSIVALDDTITESGSAEDILAIDPPPPLAPQKVGELVWVFVAFALKAQLTT